MNPESLEQLVAGNPRLFAVLEVGRPLAVRWGEDDRAPLGTLGYRKFYHPRAHGDAATWAAFESAGTFAPACSREYGASSVTVSPAARRPVASPVSSRAEWDALCARADEALRRETVRKLVLARTLHWELEPAESADLLAALPSRLFGANFPNSWRFLVKSGDSVFFGATPERLFERERGELLVPSIAGTRPCAMGDPEDALRAELLGSEKERAEHRWVVEGICEALRGLGLEPSHPAEPVVVRVPRLLHLYTPITAKDDGALAGEDIIGALHPTPAIGGYPREAAVDFLLTNEVRDRGLFASPLLFRDAERELCLVAIRSGLLTPTRLTLFAGAGYVRGSTAAGEWNETEKKLQVMQTLLFGEQP